MRKAVLLALAAVLAIVALPASPASASVANGSSNGCYTIKKKGNYNDVQAGVQVTASGKNIKVHGYVAVTKTCQKANSIPIHRITIYEARLKDARTGKVVRMADGNSATKHSIVRATTSKKYTKCGHGYTASAKISYAYTDGSYVHPFWIHGHTFTRC